MCLNYIFIETFRPYIFFKDWSKIGFVILISSFVSILFTGVLKKYAFKFSLYQRIENGRDQNKPMVRLGGIAIFSSFFLIYFFCRYFFDFNLNSSSYDIFPFPALILGTTCIFFIGIIDDLIYLSPKIRLFFQFIIGILVWSYGLRFGNIHIDFFGLGFDELTLHPFLNLFFTVVFLVGMTNAINWIDGLDGLASGNIGIGSVAISLIILFSNSPIEYLLLPLCLAGCSFGFLFYNFYPAKIYMGDGGSNFLGFIFASLSILISQKSTLSINLLTILFLNFLPIINMSIVIIERFLNNLSPFYPDKRHIHHKMLNRGLTHKKSVILLYLLTFICSSLAIIIQKV